MFCCQTAAEFLNIYMKPITWFDSSCRRTPVMSVGHYRLSTSFIKRTDRQKHNTHLILHLDSHILYRYTERLFVSPAAFSEPSTLM
jgi:hypothetical protein